MAGPDGASAELVPLWAELVQAPHQFDLFHALRRLECATADHPRLGESARAKDDPVRLCQEPSMAFAPRTIHALEPGPDGTPPRLEVLCLGLFGPNGPLPFHLTEYARDRIRVNTICIGLIKSAQWERRAGGRPIEELYAEMAQRVPLGRMGEAEEYADLVAFLVSARAAYITGTAVNLDGGLGATV